MRKVERPRRTALKRELLKEGPHDEAGRPLCQHCGGYPDYRGLHLVHLQAKSKGKITGATTRENCEIWCAPCHYGPDGHRWERGK